MRFYSIPEDKPKFWGDNHDLYVVIRTRYLLNLSGFEFRHVAPTHTVKPMTHINVGFCGHHLPRLMWRLLWS